MAWHVLIRTEEDGRQVRSHFYTDENYRLVRSGVRSLPPGWAVAHEGRASRAEGERIPERPLLGVRLGDDYRQHRRHLRQARRQSAGGQSAAPLQ
ncbi:MAG TPA: hypothetical protein VJZ91_08995 [Blastocatellia bacterium]|nr:hypothetical protein [Blastocatellia bacterium]